MKQILSKDNLNTAYLQVVRNKGAEGVDGMKYTELKEHLEKNGEIIKEQLRTRKYKPQPVRRVEIPKPDGGVRNLGVPTVTDRFVQQAITQVLNPIYEKQFHEHSYGFYFDRKAHQFKAKPHAKSVTKFKAKMKQLTCRSWGVSNSYKVQKLNELIRGWINYFKIGSMKTLCVKLDSSIRYRMRMCIWKQWKTPQNRAKKLMKLGVNKGLAWSMAYYGAHIARVCHGGAMHNAITKERLARFGLVSMLDYYTERCVTC